MLAQQAADAKAGKAAPTESKFFEVEISNPFFSGPQSLTLFDTSKSSGHTDKAAKGRKG